ncbi:hypothetical protein BB934_42340 (plasmid) [Microvirga ossetica]|uniref:Uncharacterized protein n=2 Tax=Microvirga ossetica TaxID=1882682 RepID=A0A1B2EY16_9HYPH|nr:hypothetical protein BB934_42340 [Microvirga ossetica]
MATDLDRSDHVEWELRLVVRSAGAAEDILRPWAGALDLIGGVGFDDGRREVEFDRAQGRIPPAGGGEGGTVPPVGRGTALKQGANIPRDYRMTGNRRGFVARGASLPDVLLAFQAATPIRARPASKGPG